jgi:outer membrane receptor protein involved in Fe transport
MPPRPHPYLEDRSFVRLQDLTISYAFDEITQRIGIVDLRVYFGGKNLCTWTKWTGYDPENSSTIGTFPMLRTYTFGIDFKF